MTKSATGIALPPGTWTVEMKRGAASRRAVVEVREGERALVDLRGD